MSFPPITGPTAPEEYSWTVELGPEQELEQVDEEEVAVIYSDGHQAFSIKAEPAHDAEGTAVPTSITDSGWDVVTLTVHYRAGNPTAGGAPFVYPIQGGAGWEGGFRTIEVDMDNRASEEATQSPAPQGCVVPKLKGRTLKGSKDRLRESDCRIGTVQKLKGAMAKTAKVLRQNPKPGKVLAAGAKVNVRLGRQR